VTLVLTALISAITVSLANVQYTRNKAQATKYAQEAVEWLRSQKDTLGWSKFKILSAADPGKIYCFASLDFLITQYCADQSDQQIAGTFYRDVTLTNSAVDQITATVKVSWKQGNRNPNPDVTLVTYLTNW
jgi:hypothetical protein